jgi:hypothetical protein
VSIFKYKTGEPVSRGQLAEDTFKKLLVAEGYPVRDANRQEQIQSHIDFIVNQNNKPVNYEVKARKKIRRSDPDVQDDFVWVEIQSVSDRDGNVHLGWIFGAADFIAFERASDFIVVDRLKLLDFVKTNCNLKKIAHQPEDALYKCYERKDFRTGNLRGKMTMVTMKDVESLPHRIIKK